MPKAFPIRYQGYLDRGQSKQAGAVTASQSWPLVRFSGVEAGHAFRPARIRRISACRNGHRRRRHCAPPVHRASAKRSNCPVSFCNSAPPVGAGGVTRRRIVTV